jgi:hypothetical protein
LLTQQKTCGFSLIFPTGTTFVLRPATCDLRPATTCNFVFRLLHTDNDQKL